MRELDALWKRYRQRERITDIRAALTPWTLSCIYRDSAYPAPSLDNWMADFMPWSQGPRRKQTPEDMQLILFALNAALGGEVIEHCSETP